MIAPLKTAAVLAVCCSTVFGEVRLPSIFSDNMVLQRGMPIRVWGLADPGERVSVGFLGRAARSRADTAGQWQVTLPPCDAGGPYALDVKAHRTRISFRNVMIGEVWLCSGQSNMAFALSDAPDAPDSAQVFDGNMRLFSVPRRVSDRAERDCGGSWHVCSQQFASSFSAVGFFFGRDLRKRLNVPIGLIAASWSGTPGESWTSWETMEADSMLAPIIARQKKAEAAYPTAIARYREAFLAFQADTTHKPAFQRDPGNRGYGEGYATAKFADTAWKETRLPGYWEKSEGLDIDGAIWFRKHVTIPKKWLHSTLALNLCALDDFDVTYFNGVEVGAMGMENPESYLTPRHYSIPESLVTSTDAVIAIRIFDQFGGGGFAGPPEDMLLSCGSRNECIPLYGLWRYRVELALDPRAIGGPGQPGVPYPPASPYSSSRPAGLYNGMIRPCAPLSLRGGIWYQGEANAYHAYQYRTLLPALISDWRKAFRNDSMAFGIVQLANYLQPDTVPSSSDWAELREAQLLTVDHTPKTGLAVTIDIGDENDIHPKNKLDVGRRLALWAVAAVYGDTAVEYSGPALTSAVFQGDSAILTFSHAHGGLEARGGPPRGFSVAGDDQAFAWASGAIAGNKLVLRSAAVARPVAVRYGWANNPPCNLYNKAGLPASPFRTDTWPGITVNGR